MCQKSLIAPCEECPSADPPPILFLESGMVFVGERARVGMGMEVGMGGSERESWMKLFTGGFESEILIFLGLICEIFKQTHLFQLINVTWRQ